jgi:hypothetical protein
VDLNWKALAAFVALLLALVAAVALSTLVRRPDTMTFLFTADTEGYLVPCGCRTVPAGGLARRAGVLKRLREDPSAGKVQPIEITHGFADRGPGRAILNKAMGSFFKREGYLVGIGSYDLLLGLSALKEAAPDVPLFLAGAKSLPGSVEFRLGGWGVGPIGDRGARMRVIFLAETAPGGASAPDPVKSMREEVARHPAEGYIVVGQFKPETVTALVKESPKLLAVIGQWRVEVTSAPQRAGPTWLVFMGDRGRRSAELKVWRHQGGWEALPRFAYLGPDVTEDKKVEEEVTKVLREASGVNEAALASTVKPPLKGKAYVGSVTCSKCHRAAFEKWSSTYHASATKDLSIDHQGKNPDCLACHATGLGEPGGYPQANADLAGVQCEVCHGPGEGHPPRKLASAPPSAEACGRCHGLRDSPMFKLPGFWEAIKHG